MMAAIDLVYERAADSVGLPLAISIFADRIRVREEIEEDAKAAGFGTRQVGSLACILDGPDEHSSPMAPPQALGEIVVLDCPAPDAGGLAALARLDTRAARSGAQLVVSTSVDALDDVFGCCSQSGAQILVNPSRGERMVALGRLLGLSRSGGRLREMSETDRMALMRLTEQVGEIAQRLDRIGGGLSEGLPGAASRGDRGAFSFRGDDAQEDARTARFATQGEAHVRRARPPLPDPRLVRKIIEQRQRRARFFEGDLFADPAWDMLLDLTAARAEHVRVSVTSLCIASGVPPTTALRWIGQMVEAGLFVRVEDDADRRRAFIALSDHAADAMARYFAALGQDAALLV